MLSLFEQPRFALDNASELPGGYELFIRESQAGQWRTLADFNQVTPEDITQLLMSSINCLPAYISLVSLNLEQQQFIDDRYAIAVSHVQKLTNVHIMVELTERGDANVSYGAMMLAAQRFQSAGVEVCIDDVGTGANTEALVRALSPYVNEYKFALQNVRPDQTIDDVADQITAWSALAHQHGKRFILEGIETSEDLAQVKSQFDCDGVQGYFWGKPAPLPILPAEA
ncbi:EAL domain-containing protein [Secundilactobacillus similis]|uniref:C-di-GMP-specific phosphodiesterase n=1 Tax=Secundilactobacillus similis DSM 23365 = JCM 2765 TaxID=1423804 RepID=A0A0R2EP92_9LACO|nr:EAL domain-containing protein [Secundilactobacillus similis]KRN17825.1 C-di-GMP-specific phosphodiesterase [Secundilactobacillus similis DSM 23365 = JCM 2765]